MICDLKVYKNLRSRGNTNEHDDELPYETDQLHFMEKAYDCSHGNTRSQMSKYFVQNADTSLTGMIEQILRDATCIQKKLNCLTSME